MHVPCHDCWKNAHGSKAFRVAFRSFNGNSDVIWVKYSQNQQQIEDHLWHYYNDVTVKWRKNRYCDVIDIKPISPTTYEKRVLFWSNSNSACVHMCAASLNVCWRVRTSANVRFFRGRPSEESPGFYRPVPIPVVPSLPGRDLGGMWCCRLPRMWARQLLQTTGGGGKVGGQGYSVLISYVANINRRVMYEIFWGFFLGL